MPGGINKLRLFDLSFDFTKPFTLFAILTGLVLLNVGNAGLDQDTTQRFLACEDARAGKKALYLSALATIPVVLIFLMIGSLLHIFYERPDLMGHAGAAVTGNFEGEKITVFMSFILSEVPPGVRGLVTVGVIAAAAINSGLISMSSVLINDFYRPYVLRQRGLAAISAADEMQFVRDGRIAVLVLAAALFAMSILCFYWQRYTDMPLLEFVLSVMAFAYSGLLGVYGVALFTTRGSTASVIAALAAGFIATMLQQSFIVDMLGLPESWKILAFPWQLCIGTAIAFLVCLMGNQTAPQPAATHGV